MRWGGHSSGAGPDDFPGQTWPGGPGLARAWDRSCVWGLAQGSPEVSASVRRSRLSGPEPRRRGRPGAGGQGAAPEVPGSQPPANSEFLRHELGRASVSAPAHPPLPAWPPPPPQQGGSHSQACPDPRPILNPQGWVPPLLSPTHHHSQARKGALWGVLAGGGGNAPLPHPPGLGWCDLPASSCSCPPGAGRGTGREGKARRDWTGRSPDPSSSRKGHREAFSS